MEFISVDISFSFFNIFGFKEFVLTLFERRISIVRSLETIRRFPDVPVSIGTFLFEKNRVSNDPRFSGTLRVT